jgi:hypothetical protein
MVQFLCLFSLTLQDSLEEGECRQLEFWTGKGWNRDSYSAQLQMTWKFTENYFGIYKKYWRKNQHEETHQAATSLGGAPPSLWGPWQASGPLLLLYEAICPRKKSEEDFRDKAPPSRGGTWAGAILLSGGAIPPGILPSGRGKSKPSTSPMILSSREDQSSSTSSPAPSHLKP